MRVLIIEDEPKNVEITIDTLHRIDPSIEIAGTLASVSDSIDWLTTNTLPDLILCDVRLEDGESFEIFKQVPVKTPLVFITAYDEYAREAFRVHGLRYISKPIDYNELREVVVMVGNQLNPPAPRQRLMVPVDGETLMIAIRDIVCILSDAGLTKIIKADHALVNTPMPIGKIEEQLLPTEFVKVSRRALVRIDRITSLLRHGADLVAIRVDGLDEPLAVSRNRVAVLRKALDR